MLNIGVIGYCYLEAWTEPRAHAVQYSTRLENSGVEAPQQIEGCRHVDPVYAIRTQAREKLQAADEDPQFHAGDFPCREQAAREALSLPIYAELAPEQIAAIADAIYSATPNQGQRMRLHTLVPKRLCGVVGRCYGNPT